MVSLHKWHKDHNIPFRHTRLYSTQSAIIRLKYTDDTNITK